MSQQEPEKIIFYKADLSRAYLTEIFNLDKVKFWDVLWANHGDHCAIYDELAGNPDWGIVSKTYRQLWKNYDEALEYHVAGDFHIASMRMKETYLRQTLESKGTSLKHKCRSIFILIVNGLYRSVSNYGERYGKALFWLLFSWTSWTAAYWLLREWKETATETLTQNIFCNLLQAGVTSLRVVTFQRIESVDDWRLSLIASLQILTTLPIIALFLLALKRRFKR